MFEIEYIKFKNFLSFGSKIQEIKFQKGISIITGIDIDRNRSNGSGKSSSLETIQYALFGQTSRGVKKEQIVNWKNRKNCWVELGFTKDNNKYKIIRGEKPSIFDIYINDRLLDKESHVKYYQQELEKIIGLNFQTFTSLIHTNINSSKPILEMSKQEKRSFIEKVFGLEKISDVVSKCNNKLRKISDNIHGFETKKSANKDKIKDAEDRIENFNNKIKDQQKDIDNIEKNISDLEEEINDLKKNKREDDIKNTLDELKSYEKKLANIIDSIKSKTISTKMRIRELKEGIDEDILDDPYIEGKIHIIKTEINSLDKISKDIEDKIKKESDDIIEIKVNEKTIRNNIERLREDRDTIKESDKCPLCDQKITKRAMEKKRNELTSEKKRHTRIKNERELKEKNIDNMISEKNEVSANMTKLVMAKKMVDAQKLDKLLTKQVRIDEIMRQRLDNTRHQIDDMEKSNTHIEKIQNSIDNMKNEIKSKRQFTSEFKSVIIKDGNTINECVKNNKSYDNKITKLKETRDYVSFIKDMCSDEKVKSYIISNLIPFITKQVNYYLSRTNFGFYTNFDNFLELEIKGPGITNASYKSLSGGERRGIDLSLQFAILDILKKRAKTFPDILDLDEILDSSVDAHGIMKLMEIIRVKQEDDDLKIFIISHRSDISDERNVDYVYNVEKKNGYSQISEYKM